MRRLCSARRETRPGRGGHEVRGAHDQRGDIYIDAGDTTATAAWLDPAKAQEWVLAQLKAQGITMRAA